MKKIAYIFGIIVVLIIGFVIIQSDEDADLVGVSITEVDEDHHDNDDDDDEVSGFEIYPGDVAKKIENGEDIILLDVRQPEEYEEIHLRDALLLPVEELSGQTLEKIGLGNASKDKEIIIYCRSGARAQVAYNIMSSLGYTNIKSSAGGMIHWQEDNYPFTETGEYTGINWSDSRIDPFEVGLWESPEITIVRDFYDFGVIPKSGGTVETRFPVRNTGNTALEIGTLTTSCSCTSASIESSLIEPGGSTNLTVVFDPDFHEEPLEIFKRTVFIPSNDPNQPEVEVVIQVDIDEDN
jgi:rhodanese-related sulfurtransferase